MNGQIGESISDAIGRTPIIRLGRVAPDLDREIFLKLELLNPGQANVGTPPCQLIRAP